MRFSIARTAMTLVFSASAVLGFSQEIQSKNYRYATGLEEICKKSSGAYYAGKLFEEFPSGTIFETSTIGSGYSAKYTGVSPKTGKEGILFNSSEAKAEFINPHNIIGSTFEIWGYEYDEYGYKDPAAAPKNHNLLTVNRDPNGENDDALIQVTYINNPDTNKEVIVKKEYTGKFLSNSSN